MHLPARPCWFTTPGSSRCSRVSLERPSLRRTSHPQAQLSLTPLPNLSPLPLDRSWAPAHVPGPVPGFAHVDRGDVPDKPSFPWGPHSPGNTGCLWGGRWALERPQQNLGIKRNVWAVGQGGFSEESLKLGPGDKGVRESGREAAGGKGSPGGPGVGPSKCTKGVGRRPKSGEAEVPS